MELNASEHGMKPAAKRDLIEHHAHRAADSETVQDLAGRDPADSRPLADASNAGGNARSYSFSRRPLRPVRPFFRGSLVWRLAIPQRLAQGTQILTARDDDAVAVAIATAYVHSSAVVFGLTGKMFFWELARLLPSDAHKLTPDGSVKDVPLREALAPA